MTEQSNNTFTDAMTFDPFDMLKWHIDMGADEAIAEEPVNWFETAPATTATVAPNAQQNPAAVRSSGSINTPAAISDDQVQSYLQQNQQASGIGSDPKPVIARPVQSSTGGTPQQAQAAAQSANSLNELYAALCAFDGGHIKRSARNTVFADGVQGAPIMFIGESPGIEEDRQGKPFVGQAGSMLDTMLAAAGMSRENNCYITNLLPWRLMGKPVPTPEMIAMCLPFLRRHIELAKPQLVITLGKISAQALLGSEGSITKFHGKWQDLPLNDQTFAAMPAYHPAYLMKATHLKKEAWQDLLKIKHKAIELGIL